MSRLKKISYLSKDIVKTLYMAITIYLAIYILFTYVLINGNIPSGSMEPTILTNNRIIVNQLAYINDTPKTGNVIVFWSEKHNSLLVKRVIGVSGDVVDLKDGKVYINNTEIYEFYIQGQTWSSSLQDERFIVPEGKLFVMGDNRENSCDSRFFDETFVDIDDVKGKAFLHYSLDGDDGVYVETIYNGSPVFYNTIENKK